MNGPGEEILSDFMLKRAMSRAMFGAQNYKDRWIVLTKDALSYYSGNLAVSITSRKDSDKKVIIFICIENWHIILTEISFIISLSKGHSTPSAH